MDSTPHRYTYRLAPCSAFDFERMQSWLTDLSDQGLLLTDKAVLLGLVKLERTAPRHMVYRADASPDLLTGAPPEDGAAEPNAHSGWEYAGRRGPFHYYRTAQPASRELHTDPAVQAASLRKTERRLWLRILCFLLLLVLFPLFRVKFCVLLLTLSLGTPYLLLWSALVLYLIGDALSPIIRLRRLRRRFVSTGALERRKSWRKGAMAYRIRSVLLPVVAAVVFILIFVQASWGMEKGSVLSSDYDGQVPFATAAELFGTEFAPDAQTRSTSANRVRRWRDLLAPENITWVESGTITTSGDETDIYYSVEYHQMRNPVLARWLAKEVLRYRMEPDCVRVEPPALETDVVCAYLDGIGIPHLILVRDTQVVHVSLWSAGGGLLLEDWASAFAAQLEGTVAFSSSD